MGSLYFLPCLTKTHIIRKFKAAKKGKSNEKRKKQDYTFYHIVDLFGNIPNFIHKVLPAVKRYYNAQLASSATTPYLSATYIPQLTKSHIICSICILPIVQIWNTIIPH